jgi:hypothetical protein
MLVLVRYFGFTDVLKSNPKIVKKEHRKYTKLPVTRMQYANILKSHAKE